MLQSLNRAKVIIDNEEYTVISNYSNRHVNAATELLNDEIEQLKKLVPELDDKKRAILLALNTVSKQIVLEQEVQRLNKQLKRLQIEAQSQQTGSRQVSKNDGQRLSKQQNLFARQTSLEDFANVFTSTNSSEVYKPALFNQKGDFHE